jgi:hypothetical protein
MQNPSVPRILSASLCDSTTSSSMLTICPAWPGSGRRRLAGRCFRAENEIVIGTDENAPVGMCFMPVADPKTVKNRVHLDLTSSAADRDQEIARLLALGEHRVDIGQTGRESWTVLADPEGNEFCVVRPKETLIRYAQHREPQTDPVRGRRGCPKTASRPPRRRFHMLIQAAPPRSTHVVP